MYISTTNATTIANRSSYSRFNNITQIIRFLSFLLVIVSTQSTCTSFSYVITTIAKYNALRSNTVRTLDQRTNCCYLSKLNNNCDEFVYTNRNKLYPYAIQQIHKQRQNKFHSILKLVFNVRGGQIDTTISETQIEAVTPESITSNKELPQKKELANVLSSSSSSSLALPLFVTTMSSIGNLYSEALKRSPILTKSITAGIIFTLSDILAQCLEQQKQIQIQIQKQHGPATPSPSTSNNNNKIIDSTTCTNNTKKQVLNMKRILASGIVGFAYFGPAAHYWYEWIFYILPGTSFRSTIQKAILGQVLFGPAFICIFIASSLFQSYTFTIQSWYNKIYNDLPGAILAGMGFWPFVDFISYSYISPQWIPLFVNLCSLVWTTYLALRTYSK